VPTIQDFTAAGQSIWYDYLRRSFITSGDMQALVDQGLRGITSNPSIFEAAMEGSVEYDGDMKRLFAQNKSAEEVFETLMLDDVAKAADLLRPVYDSLGRADGYVSVEVSPRLARDTSAMVEQARRFFYKLDRPNVMVTIPATDEGIPAVRILVAEGINVDITLVFSIDQYKAVVEAYMDGLEELASKGGDLGKVSSVASFFVSRVDTAVDRELEKVGDESLQGKIAIANAKVVYAEFKKAFTGERWRLLEAKGARIQRPLWASTSTKKPAYPDTLYVDSLIGEGTVDTVPPATLQAVLDHGRAVPGAVEEGLDDARRDLGRLSSLGLDLDAITGRLQADGLTAFAKSLDILLSSIERRRKEFVAESPREFAFLGEYGAIIDASLKQLAASDIIHRIWTHDYSIWKPEPTEISNRLDWLHTPGIMLEHLPRFNELVEEVRSAGYTRVVLLGMGGSSLAPAVFADVFGGMTTGYPKLNVLDNTDPDTIMDTVKGLDLEETLFIVSSKSGGTVETLSLMKYFYGRVSEAVGGKKAAERFVVITDPGSNLAAIAEKNVFRAEILNDPNIGGRYSVISYDGLVPAALLGVDIAKLVGQAMSSASACEPSVEPRDNPGAWLGVVLGELHNRGRDKLTFFISPRIESFGNWVEQLIAESTGKEGKGILPVVGARPAPVDTYGSDRVFVVVQLDGDEQAVSERELNAIKSAGHPVLHLRIHDVYELGGQFFLWEMAVAVAGSIMGINPFDQPNVESAKALARKMVADYKVRGSLPNLTPRLVTDDVAVYGDVLGETPSAVLVNFLKGATPGAYIAIQAYVEQTEATDNSLHQLRGRLMRTFKLATTVGYGPRFLHSTGQLHKGDAGRGLFIQITSDKHEELRVPDELGSTESSVSFGTLEEAEALGDRQALLDGGREIVRFHIRGDVPRALDALTEATVNVAVSKP
jgi:transaldolase / glucose-6-phosphate isomerase